MRERNVARILHVLPNLLPAGAETMAVDLMVSLDRKRFRVAAVSMFARSGTELETRLEEAGIETYYLDKRPGFDPRMYPRLDRVVSRFRPDLLHTHTYVLRYVLPILYLRSRLGVHTVHNIAQKETDLPGRMVHHLAFRSRVVAVAIAEEVRKTLKALYNLDHVELIPNGVPVTRFSEASSKRSIVRARESVPDSIPVVICVARLSEQKNHSLLLDAFAAIDAVRARPLLWLVGQGELRRELEEKARRLDLADRVRFLGMRSDVPELLAASDLFVLSSSWEGNPLSIMEAMAAGKPIVATAVGGVPELIEDGRDGILVPGGDASALARAMESILIDRALAGRLGEAAKAKATGFDVAQMARTYEALYERVLG